MTSKMVYSQVEEAGENVPTRVLLEFVQGGNGLACTFHADAESCLRAAWEAYGHSPTSATDVKTYAVLMLAARLRHWLHGMSPLRTDNTVYGALLTSTLNLVNWDAIAQCIIDATPTSH